MKIVKIFFPGDFIDVFAYRGRLLVFASDKSVRVISLDKLASHLEAKLPTSVPLPDLLFARNNWMSDPSYRLFIRNPLIADVLLKAVDQVGEEVHEYNLSAFEINYFDLKGASYNYPLDVNIYNGRLYLGTDKGFFHQNFSEWIKDDLVEPVGDLVERHSAKTVHTSAKYGTINISCATDGLFCALDEFDVRGRGDEKKDFDRQTTSSSSYRSDWCSYDVVNYEDSSEVKLLTTTHEPHEAFGLERENQLLTGFKATVPFWDISKKTDRPKISVDLEEIDYVFNSDQVFFIHSLDGNFYKVRMSYVQNKSDRVLQSPSLVLGGQVAGISKTLSLQYGFKRGKAKKFVRKTATVVEGFEGVTLLSEEGLVPISKNPARTVRTFPNSKQYVNLVAITAKDGLYLNAVFDDSFLKESIDVAQGNLTPQPTKDDYEDAFGDYDEEQESEDDSDEEDMSWL